ncbi:MAG: hypothetical protein ACI4ET_02580, partial [Bilifractor sp.]
SQPPFSEFLIFTSYRKLLSYFFRFAFIYRVGFGFAVIPLKAGFSPMARDKDYSPIRRRAALAMGENMA